ncbi:MAG: MmgE/PrpD family protein [Deltaproteobacteria bacterium]|nr:MmgE/PrpD family protein [Deltaproteobacteria bacterium]
MQNQEKKRITESLSAFVAESAPEAIPEKALHEAKRSLLDTLGAALAGSRHRAVTILQEVLVPEGKGETRVIGRGIHADLYHATLLNGYMGHVYDFDDTHVQALLHPSVPVWMPILALSGRKPVSGRQALAAFVLGYEVEARLGMALAPLLVDRQWHVTGMVGGIGAAAAVGKLLGLSAERQAQAFGIAATYGSGLLDMAGSMSKGLHPGKAAQSGLFAALAVEKGLTSSKDVFGSNRGFFHVNAGRTDFEEIVLTGLGEGGFELYRNSYKPYPCGFLGHAAIDAAIALRNASSLAPAEEVEEIRIEVHPLVLDAMGNRTPKTGLEGKFSVYHCVASGFIDGTCGLSHYTDEKVKDARIAALREKIAASVNPSFGRTEAKAVLVLKNGDRHETHVPHASGTEGNPMADAQLETKFLLNASAIIGEAKSRELAKRIWEIETCSDIGQIVGML